MRRKSREKRKNFMKNWKKTKQNGETLNRNKEKL